MQSALAKTLVGHSGFEVRYANGEVIKRASGVAAERLERQCSKQQSFIIRHPRFSICKVLSAEREGSGFSFRMPHHRGETAVEFVDRARPALLLEFAHDVSDLALEFVADCQMLALPREAVVEKSRAVAATIERSRWCAAGMRSLIAGHLDRVAALPDIQIPIGKCHGDLTFSNILFDAAGPAYTLIDFLDPYLETPLMDMAKLRQETYCDWSSLAATTTHDRSKYRIAMAAVREVVEESFRRLPWYAALIDVFETQNLLRVVQYAQDETVVAALGRRLSMIQEAR